MATQLEQLKPMRIGVDNVVVAVLKEDSAEKLLYGNQTTEGESMEPTIAGGVVTAFKGLYNLPGVMTMNINPNVSQEVAFFDDGPGETASTLGAIEVSFTKSSLSPTEKALLLGKRAYKIGDKTGVISSSNDVPPYVAIGFRTMRSDNSYRYVWLLKGKFVEPAENNETKGDSINFQSEEITGKFLRVNRVFETEITVVKADGTPTRKIKPWKIEAEGDDTTAATNIAKWFKAPILPKQKADAEEVIVEKTKKDGGK